MDQGTSFFLPCLALLGSTTIFAPHFFLGVLDLDLDLFEDSPAFLGVEDFLEGGSMAGLFLALTCCLPFWMLSCEDYDSLSFVVLTRFLISSSSLTFSISCSFYCVNFSYY